LATIQFPSTGKFPVNPYHIVDTLYCIIRVKMEFRSW